MADVEVMQVRSLKEIGDYSLSSIYFVKSDKILSLPGYEHLKLGSTSLGQASFAVLGDDGQNPGSDDFRKYFMSQTGKGLWTSTFRVPRNRKRSEIVPKGFHPVTIVVNPESVKYKNEKCIVDPNSGDSFDLLEPPSGVVTEFNFPSGYPTMTRNMSNLDDDNLPFFIQVPFSEKEGPRQVMIHNRLDGEGTKYTIEILIPDSRYGDVGLVIAETEPGKANSIIENLMKWNNVSKPKFPHLANDLKTGWTPPESDYDSDPLADSHKPLLFCQ